MALPASELWAKIQKELSGKPNPEQIAILRRHLSSWPDEWKGPYRDLKTRLVKLLARLDTTEAVKSSSDKVDPFYIKRQGDGQVAVVGVTNVGKSAIVSSLTSAPVQIADYPFATQAPVPGMLQYCGASIQIIDTPAIVSGLAAGEGAGQRLIQVLKATDALIIVVDVAEDLRSQAATIRNELEGSQILLRPHPVNTVLHVKGKNGICFRGASLQKDEQLTARRLLADAGIENAVIEIRDGFSQFELAAQIDRKTLLPAIIVGNKNDLLNSAERVQQLRQAFEGYQVIDVNCLDEMHFEELKTAVFSLLSLQRVDILSRPSPDAACTTLIVRRPVTVSEIVRVLDLADSNIADLSARVWGRSVKHGGQPVGADHVLDEADRIFIQ